MFIASLVRLDLLTPSVYLCHVQDEVLPLLANISSSLATGNESLLDPGDALRDANAYTSVLEYAPEPTSAEELDIIVDLKVLRRSVWCGWWYGGSRCLRCEVV